MSYYRQMNGVKYKRSLLETAEKIVSNSEQSCINRSGAKTLLKYVIDGGQITAIEKQTISYLRKKLTWTKEADQWFRRAINEWLAKNSSDTALTKYLASQTVGLRSRFWFCPKANPPLQLESLTDPSGRERIINAELFYNAPPGAQQTTGIVFVGEDGRMIFGSTLLQQGMLESLADWVHENLTKYPKLAHLGQSIFIQISEDGGVLERHENPDCWKDVQPPAIHGSLAKSASIIAKLSTDKTAWIWFASGPENVPRVIVYPLVNAKSDTRFAQLVYSNRSQLNVNEAGLRGTLHRLSGGKLFIMTNDEIAERKACHSWLRDQGVSLICRVEKEEIVEIKRLRPPLSTSIGESQSKALEAIQATKETFLFWYTKKSKTGKPMLLIGASKTELMVLIKENTTSAPAVKGRIKLAKWGFEFQTRTGFPDLLSEIADWVAVYCHNWPRLLELKGSRWTVRDKEWNIVERHKNDPVWKNIKARRK